MPATTTPVSVRPERASTLVEVKPNRWALSLWARWFRRVSRRWLLTRHVDRFCKPLRLEGVENFAQLRSPALYIANHTSHFDTAVVLGLLPGRLYHRTAVVAAADRFYTQKLKSAWYSLRFNSVPITRGGGRAALSYCEGLLEDGWSLLIFPEGTRSKTGELLPFHPGPAILALGHGVPVVPISIEGTSNILAPKTKRARPAAVRVRIGEPLEFPVGTSVLDATHMMEERMRSLARSDRAGYTAVVYPDRLIAGMP